jgi:hypothetical protein
VLAGIGIGLVNAPLASAAIAVVAREREGTASGVDNAFRQVGIATGIAALGALFSTASRARSRTLPEGAASRLGRAVASGEG